MTQALKPSPWFPNSSSKCGWGKGAFKFLCSPLAPTSSIYSLPCHPMDVISGLHCTDSDVSCSPFLKSHKKHSHAKAVFVFIRSLYWRFGGRPNKSLPLKELQVELQASLCLDYLMLYSCSASHHVFTPLPSHPPLLSYPHSIAQKMPLELNS